jgi:hypothetical protein
MTQPVSDHNDGFQTRTDPVQAMVHARHGPGAPVIECACAAAPSSRRIGSDGSTRNRPSSSHRCVATAQDSAFGLREARIDEQT